MTGQSLSRRQERRGELAVNQAPPHLTCVSRVDVPSGTPGRPPFSSMNSTPAVSENALWNADGQDNGRG
jgi:hypothetical protein